MQIPILNGIYSDERADFRTSYPRNLVPVPKDQGISKGYLRPAEGIEEIASGSGSGRGGIRWNDELYRIMGSSLVKIAADGTITTIGSVGAGEYTSRTVGFDRIAIASGGDLYYYDGTALSQVTDADLGNCIDVHWFAGYYVFTDGDFVGVTELNDPMSINPLKYGGAESKPDKIVAIDDLKNEVVFLGKKTIEFFQNVGGDLFPFQRIDGAVIHKGVIGTHAYCNTGEAFVFLGGGEDESPSIYIAAGGRVQPIATREIDQILQEYTEAELESVVCERRADKKHEFYYFHLPDRTIVFDQAASQASEEFVWHILDSGTSVYSRYRARGFVWVYDAWHIEDPTTTKLGVLTAEKADHFGDVVAWEFGTLVLYGAGTEAIVHEIELVCLTGRVALGIDPVIWTSYSTDGETWSLEKTSKAGKQGQRNKRICWRSQGIIENMRMQKFRGTSDAFLSIARLEMTIEPLDA